MLYDLLLTIKIKQGDIKCFKEVFDNLYAPLCLFSSCIVGDSDEAEEVVQELFYTLWKNRQSLPKLYSLKSYLYQAAKNESLQYVEHQHVEKRYREAVKKKVVDRHDADPQRQMELDELDELINRSFTLLSEREHQIFCMHRFDGYKYSEIAAALNISVKTVEADMTRALKRMRKVIDQYYKS